MHKDVIMLSVNNTHSSEVFQIDLRRKQVIE
jgi:hypothetical protein